MMKATNTVIILLLTAVMLVACDSGPSVGKVGGKSISKKQFDAYAKFKRLPSKDEARMKEILNDYLEREAMAAAIEQTKELDEDLINAELNEFRKEMLISRYFESFLINKVNDQAIQNYYSANANNYEQKKVHVAHILLRTNRTTGEAELKAKQTTAQAAWSAIHSGKKFKDVAKEYSEDANSAKKGGDLGWLKEGSIDKPFSEKVFSMKVDEISEPFETSFGFHIVKLIEGPVKVKQPLEAVKGDIRYQLRNQTKQAEIKRLTSIVSIEQK